MKRYRAITLATFLTAVAMFLSTSNAEGRAAHPGGGTAGCPGSASGCTYFCVANFVGWCGQWWPTGCGLANAFSFCPDKPPCNDANPDYFECDYASTM